MKLEEEKCRCGHPKSWHERNVFSLADAAKFCESVNGACSKRSCSCWGYVALAEIEKETHV